MLCGGHSHPGCLRAVLGSMLHRVMQLQQTNSTTVVAAAAVSTHSPITSSVTVCNSLSLACSARLEQQEAHFTNFTTAQPSCY
jgi:hypothetical protein